MSHSPPAFRRMVSPTYREIRSRNQFSEGWRTASVEGYLFNNQLSKVLNESSVKSSWRETAGGSSSSNWRIVSSMNISHPSKSSLVFMSAPLKTRNHNFGRFQGSAKTWGDARAHNEVPFNCPSVLNEP